jgi:hypothetical protein
VPSARRAGPLETGERNGRDPAVNSAAAAVVEGEETNDMKTLTLVAFLGVLLFPRGGTLCEFPLRGTVLPAKVAAVVAAVAIETFDCPQHETKAPAKLQLPRCTTCGKAMVRTTAKLGDRHLVVEVRDDRLRVVAGPWSGLGLLRRSTLVAALRDSGAALAEQGCRLRGHVLLDLTATERADGKALAKVLADHGTVDGEPGAAPLLLLHLAERAVAYDALAAAVRGTGYEVHDVAWIVNQCGGEIVGLP